MSCHRKRQSAWESEKNVLKLHHPNITMVGLFATTLSPFSLTRKFFSELSFFSNKK